MTLKQKLQYTEDIGTVDNFLNSKPLSQPLRSTIDKWGLTKLKSLCKAKDTMKRTKENPTFWEKIVISPTLQREIMVKIYKKPKKLDTNKANPNMVYSGKWSIPSRGCSGGRETINAHLQSSLSADQKDSKSPSFTSQSSQNQNSSDSHADKDIEQREHSSIVGGRKH